MAPSVSPTIIALASQILMPRFHTGRCFQNLFTRSSVTGDENRASDSVGGKNKPNISSKFSLYSVEIIQAVHQYKFWPELYCTDVIPRNKKDQIKNRL